MGEYLSVFDLDKTLISANSSYCFSHYLYTKKVLSRYHLAYALFYRLRFEFFSLSLAEFHHKILGGVLLGISLDELEFHLEGFLKEFLPQHIYYPTFSVLRLAQHLGHRTVILSNSPDFIVRPFAEYFEVDLWQATEYKVDKEGRLCKIANLMEGGQKAQSLVKIREEFKIAKENTSAYTDSHHDLPLLLEAGKPCAVNPDPKLLDLAKQRQWRVI